MESSDSFKFRIGTVKNLRMQFEGKEECKERVTEERKEAAVIEGPDDVEKSANSIKIGESRQLGSLTTSGQGSAANLRLFSNGPIGRQVFGGKSSDRLKNHESFDRDKRGSKHFDF